MKNEQKYINSNGCGCSRNPGSCCTSSNNDKPAFADNQRKKSNDNDAKAGNGGIGGAGGAGGVAGNGGINEVKHAGGGNDQDANGGNANGGDGGDANGGNACNFKCGANSH